MAKEIDRPKADVVKLRPIKRFLGQQADILSLKQSCLALANEIERLAPKTPWPNWSINQANSLRDFSRDLPD